MDVVVVVVEGTAAEVVAVGDTEVEAEGVVGKPLCMQ